MYDTEQLQTVLDFIAYSNTLIVDDQENVESNNRSYPITFSSTLTHLSSLVYGPEKIKYALARDFNFIRSKFGGVSKALEMYSFKDFWWTSAINCSTFLE